MEQDNQTEDNDKLRPEYFAGDLKNGVRGKYIERLAQRSNVVRLAPDVAAVFATEEDVNDALRGLIQLAQSATRQAA